MLVSCDAEKRKKKLSKFEEGWNNFDLKNNADTSSNNSLKKEDDNYRKRVLESQIKKSGPKVKFKSNQITLHGELAFRRILGVLYENPNHLI